MNQQQLSAINELMHYNNIRNKTLKKYMQRFTLPTSNKTKQNKKIIIRFENINFTNFN